MLRDAREASDAMVRNGQPLKAGLGRWTLGLLQKKIKVPKKISAKDPRTSLLSENLWTWRLASGGATTIATTSMVPDVMCRISKGQ